MFLSAPLSAVLFDLDGTLIDPFVGIRNSLRHALEHLNWPLLDDSTIELMIGSPLQDSLERFLGMQPSDVERAVAAFREYFEVRGMYEADVYHNVPSLLMRLANERVPIAVATSKPELFAERILEHFGLRQHISVVAGATLDGSRRVKADVIASAIHRLNNPDISKAVMVGDRSYDIVGAQRVGIPGVGVTWGFGTREELSAAGATAIAETVNELDGLLQSPMHWSTIHFSNALT